MIITSDWHLDDKPSNEYRWKVFDEARRIRKKYDDPFLYVLGDVTDKKDNHSATFVNRVVDEVVGLTHHFSCVRILVGNHDYWLHYYDPFFRFLNYIEGIELFTSPCLVNDDATHDKNVLLVPNGCDPQKEIKDHPEADYAFLHHTVNGVVASNGSRLSGPSLSAKAIKKCISGDIHVPQRCGSVTYVGSPHPVKFGDTFKPRMLVLNQCGSTKTVYTRTIQKVTITVSEFSDVDEMDVDEGDHVKAILKVTDRNKSYWRDIQQYLKQTCEQNNIQLSTTSVDGSELYGPKAEQASTSPAVASSPDKILSEYARQENISIRVKKIGKKLLS